MNERRIHQIFQVSVLVKGADALIECAGGLALALVSTNTIAGLVNTLTQEELVEDPEDFVATHLLVLAQNFRVSTKQFYAVSLNLRTRCFPIPSTPHVLRRRSRGAIFAPWQPATWQ